LLHTTFSSVPGKNILHERERKKEREREKEKEKFGLMELEMEQKNRMMKYIGKRYMGGKKIKNSLAGQLQDQLPN